MEGRNELLLINYLDRTLEEREMREMEALINSDAETRKQWQFLQLAVDAVEYSAIYDQVASVRENSGPYNLLRYYKHLTGNLRGCFA